MERQSMNRNLLLLAGLALVSGMAAAQGIPTPSTDVRGAAGGAASQGEQRMEQVLKDKAGATQTTAKPPSPPAGGTKVAPVPKTKEEEAAMKDAISKASDPAAFQAAVDDFAAKYPDSNVRGMLYRQLMLVYEQQGNADKGYEAGRKALTFDPDDPLTLSDCALYLASHTHDSDLDKDERLADARKMGNDAVANIDQLRLSAQASAEDREKFKKSVLSQAYSALGIADHAAKNWPSAEKNYAKSVELSPDAATMLRLGFTQRMQNKLDAALVSFTKAIDAAKASKADDVEQFATQQKESVEKQLAKQKATPAAATPAAGAPVAIAPVAATPAAATQAPTTPKQ
jgi:tetratricopeptide (TPR) repeat protein